MTAVKLKTNVRGLDVLGTVYAFAMALGLTQVFTGSQQFLTRILSGTAPLSDEKALLMLLMFFNITMLGLRFFWVPRNLQSLVIAFSHARALTGGDMGATLSDRSIAFHLFMIFLHGTLFYLICAEFEFVAFATSSNIQLSASVFVGYIVMHAALLLLNAVWIAIVLRQQDRHLAAALGPQAADTKTAGDVWWRNNLIASVVAIAPFALTSTCRSATGDCARQSLAHWSDVATLFPTAPQVFATIFYDIGRLLAAVGIETPHLAIYWVFVVFLANSAWDLLNAGKFYVFFEDVEWERVVERARSDGPLIDDPEDRS